MKKRLWTILLSVCLLVGLMPSTAFAASWSPTDTITITVDVFDLSTNKTYQNVGTDTVKKGDSKIQSESYRIPDLSKITGSSNYGRIQEVTGNWYGYYSSCNVGTNVYFSCNNSTARITYWVSYYGTASGGSTSSGDGTVNYDKGGSNQWTQTIVYHANYPDGTDSLCKVNYNIKNHTTIANHNLKEYNDCGFSCPTGYTLRDRVWDTQKDGKGTNYADGGNYTFRIADKNTTIHLYAQYEEPTINPSSRYTITYYDGTTVVGEDIVVAGQSTTTMSALQKDNSTFLGWSTTNGGKVTHEADKTITPTSDMKLYAVWQSNGEPTPTTPALKDLKIPDTAAFEIICETDNSHKNTKTLYELTKETTDYTVSGPTQASDGSYVFEVTLNTPSTYYPTSTTHTAGDTAAVPLKITATLNADGTAWTASCTNGKYYCKCEKTGGEQEETKPPVYVYAKTVDSEGKQITPNDENSAELSRLKLTYNYSKWLNLGKLTTDQTLTEEKYGSESSVFEKVVEEVETDKFNHSHNKSVPMNLVKFDVLKLVENVNHDGMSGNTICDAYHLDGKLTLYEVTFNKNTTDAVSNMPDNGYYYDGEDFPTKTPTRDGYTFTGWYEDEACTSEKKFDAENTTTVTKNMILYAGWQEDSGESEYTPNLTVTKTFKGIETIPSGFEIVLSNKEYAVPPLKTTDEDVTKTTNSDGTVTYTWKKCLEVETEVGTTFTIEERNADIDGYDRSTTYKITSAIIPQEMPSQSELDPNIDGNKVEVKPDNSNNSNEVYVAEKGTSTVEITNTYTASSELIPPSGPTHTTRYIVKFDSNGGSAVADKILYSITGKVIEGVNAPTLEGKQFSAWTYEGAAVGENDTFYGLTKNFTTKTITLIAQWTEEEQPVPPTDEESGDKPNGNNDTDKANSDTDVADNDADDTENANDVPKTGDGMTQSMLVYLLAAAAALLGIRKTAKSRAK